MTREQKLEEALRRLTAMRKGIETDVSSAHSNRGNGASEWMREDDRDFRRELSKVFDAADAALTAGEEAGGNPVGEAGNMPGTDGFTMACFKAIDVPAGTKLYTHSTPSPIVDDAMVERATHRHKKRGTEYVLIGIGKMQAEDWYDAYPTGDADTVDMREVAIYRGVDDGSLWVRPREEFEDGRFEALNAALSGAREGGE